VNVEHAPVGEFLACPSKRTALAVSTSNLIIWFLTFWLLLHQVGNPFTAFNQVKSHVQHVKVSIDHIHTKKVARNSRRQSKAGQGLT